jgi:hypothetical protein
MVHELRDTFHHKLQCRSKANRKICSHTRAALQPATRDRALRGADAMILDRDLSAYQNF